MWERVHTSVAYKDYTTLIVILSLILSENYASSKTFSSNKLFALQENLIRLRLKVLPLG